MHFSLDITLGQVLEIGSILAAAYYLGESFTIFKLQHNLMWSDFCERTGFDSKAFQGITGKVLRKYAKEGK